MNCKKVLLSCMLTLLMIQPLPSIAINQSSPSLGGTVESIELQDPDQLSDIIINLLMRALTDAVWSFYEPYLTTRPTVADYYGTELTAIQHVRTEDYDAYYTFTIEVTPYVGPHLSVGKDKITLCFNNNELTVINYEHLESHTLPPHYQSVLKQPLP